MTERRVAPRDVFSAGVTLQPWDSPFDSLFSIVFPPAILSACSNGYYNPFKSMTAQLPAQPSSIFNSSEDILLKTSVVCLFYFSQIYKPGIYHRGENPVRSQSKALCCFWGLGRFFRALWPKLEERPQHNKWRTAAASLFAGARGPASTHSTLYQVRTAQGIHGNTGTVRI